MVAHLIDDPRHARIAFVEVIGASPAVEAHRHAAMEHVARLLQTTGNALIAHGQISPRTEIELEVEIQILIGGVREVLMAWLSRDPATRPPLQAVTEAMLMTFRRAVR